MAAFTFGVIADVQWADVDDGFSYDRTVRRCFRGALQQLQAAAQWWAAAGTPTFVAQMGDLIDGQNAALGKSEAALDAALEALGRVDCPKLHLLGNHELYNFSREELARRLGGPTFYYSMVPAAGFRVVVLDSFRESIILPGRGDNAAVRELTQAEGFRNALVLLQANNPNDVLRGGDWLKGLHGTAQRFVPYNGGLGAAQLAWFRRELTAAVAAGERVLVLSHAILHPEACDGSTLVFDYEPALQAVASSGCVVAVLCGHAHGGHYHHDVATGVHHITFQSPLNKGADGTAYGRVAVHADRLVLTSPALADLLSPKALARGVLPQPRPAADGASGESIELLFGW